ncbi:MAG: ParB/RepB/Spo0J family partition protein [Desulfobacterales bacterium]|nr:ParB/RepB/Spo0J family partition protein [Desulfobacterales bacterium]
METLIEIPISKIKAGEHEQRFEDDDDEIIDLAGSIRRVGLLDPLCVSESGDGYMLIAGHRRLEACKRAGETIVPCLVKSGDEATRREITFAENFFRKDLTALEQAVAIANEFKEGRMTIEQLAAGFRKTTDWVRRQIAICSWPQDVLEGIQTRKLSVAAASNLACITEDHYRQMLVRHAVDNGATARTTAAWLQAWKSLLPPAEAIEQEPVDPDAPAVPMVPQSLCLVCHDVFRVDELSHVPLCSHCINAISNAVPVLSNMPPPAQENKN